MVIVDHGLRRRIVEQRVDGEVAARGVLFLRTEHVVAQDAAVLVGELQRAGGSTIAAAVRAGRGGCRCRFRRRLGRGGGTRRAEGRDLDRVGAEHHVDQPEAPPDDVRAPEQVLDLLGRGIGRDVEVLRLDLQQQIAHRPADDEGLEAGVLQRLGDARGVGGNLLRVDAVRGRRDHHGPGGLAPARTRGTARGRRGRGTRDGPGAVRDAGFGRRAAATEDATDQSTNHGIA